MGLGMYGVVKGAYLGGMMLRCVGGWVVPQAPYTTTTTTTNNMNRHTNRPGGYDSFGSCMHWGPYFALDYFEMTCQSYTLPKVREKRGMCVSF